MPKDIEKSEEKVDDVQKVSFIEHVKVVDETNSSQPRVILTKRG